MELGTLLRTVHICWRFNEKNYPRIPQVVLEARHFARQHILLHINKEVGRLARVIEKQDHGPLEQSPDPFKAEGEDRKEVKKAIRNLFINAAQLANLYQIERDDLEQMINAWAKEYTPNS